MSPPSFLARAAAASVVPWATLNNTLSGRLQQSLPLELPCFTTFNGQANQAFDEAACAAVRANYTLNSLRIDTAESYMQINNQMCLSNPADQCVLAVTDTTTDVADMPPANNSNCALGSVPSYFIDVQSVDDAAAAFLFAKDNGVEVSIKNSGHDFMTRASGKGTLALWTHNLQGMTYHDAFVPTGCSTNDTCGVGAAMTVMAGVPIVDAYNFADAHDALILGPYAPSVAFSANWVMGGGHSVFSPVFGLGADRVVEFDLVTPDGVHRVANAYQNADLFWALRGGGGGTFGLVLSATHRVEPKVDIAYADIHLPANVTAEDSLAWVELLLEESLAWGQAGWGGHVGGTFVTHFNPLPALTADKDGSAARAAFKRAEDFALALGGTSNILVSSSFADLYNTYNVPNDYNMGGNFHFVSGRLMPKSRFETEEGRQGVIDYMRRAMDAGFDPRSMYSPVTTPFVYTGNGSSNTSSADRGTSMTPAWYDALWSFETSGSLLANSTYAERLAFLKTLTNFTVQAEALSGAGSGTYQNEANPFTPDWKEAYWGAENYEKLLAIKNKYDPDRMLKCWKCVGFEEADMVMERFVCNAGMQKDLTSIFGGS